MAVDIFLKIATIDGESTDDKHKGEIEIQSYSWAVSQPATGSKSAGGAQAAQRADFADFTITKKLDKASPKLALACAAGEHIKEVTITLNRAGGDKQKYMEYKMSDVIVSSYVPSGSEGGDVPMESVSFNYAKIVSTYTETDPSTGKPKGNVSSGWDLKLNKKA
jgi:type VI secretion system secreted protein Hcp